MAHAYYQLRRQGATVLAKGEKEYSRIRRGVNWGKLVRDKIPSRIAMQQERERTQKIPAELAKRFLISKLIEEALEVREAVGRDERTVELADIYEILRALASAERISLDEIVSQADQKREKAGGFDEGLLLLQTGIVGPSRVAEQDSGNLTQVLAHRTSAEAFEIPFSLFGFMELNQTRSLFFEEPGVRLYLTLRGDRLEIRLAKEPEQMELPLDLEVG